MKNNALYSCLKNYFFLQALVFHTILGGCPSPKPTPSAILFLLMRKGPFAGLRTERPASLFSKSIYAPASVL